MIRRLELTRDMHEALIAHCRSREIGFFSTGFDPKSIDLLADLGLTASRFLPERSQICPICATWAVTASR